MESKKLYARHVWALGVGIVLVGNFMGWNIVCDMGGINSAIIGLFVLAIMYIGQVLMASELSLIVPETGGHYSIAKYTFGKTVAFDVGVMQFLEYLMLEAGDVIVVGQLVHIVLPEIPPFLVTFIIVVLLTLLNYKGTYTSLSVNFVITVLAFLSIIIVLWSTRFWSVNRTIIDYVGHGAIDKISTKGLLSIIGVSCWFFLGVEGTIVVRDECVKPERDIPKGAIFSLITLMFAGFVTIMLCEGVIDRNVLAKSIYPIYDAALATGNSVVITIAFIGTILACLSSANGCINDASNILATMAHDGMIPTIFEKKHKRYNSNYYAIFLIAPLTIILAISGMLDQVVAFSIFSALVVYFITIIMYFKLKCMKIKPLNKDSFKCPLYPILPIASGIVIILAIVGLSLSYGKNVIVATLFYVMATIIFEIFNRYTHKQ